MTYVRNKQLMSQIIDFNGLLYGKCRPTDIDLSLDFNKEVFIFAELKFRGTALTLGQRIHLMGLVDAIEAGGRMAYAVVSWHETPKGEDIQARDSVVKNVYFEGAWHPQESDVTLDMYMSACHDSYLTAKQEQQNDS